MRAVKVSREARTAARSAGLKGFVYGSHASAAAPRRAGGRGHGAWAAPGGGWGMAGCRGEPSPPAGSVKPVDILSGVPLQSFPVAREFFERPNSWPSGELTDDTAGGKVRIMGLVNAVPGQKI